MNKKLSLLLFLAAGFFSNAQNVGINTTSPQASLDVKGTERVGGINNYVKYDSATGKIEWVGASLFTTTSQQIIKHSASAEGMYAGGGKLDYRNSTGTPVFFSDWTTGNGYFSGNLGIGVVNPGTNAKLQIRDGASGITPFFSARVVVETNSHTYVNLLAPDPFETGILFGSGGTAVSGLISYNSTTVPKGFIFNNNGNQTRMVINSAGNVGIGTQTPNALLSLSSTGTELIGTAMSNTLRTNAGSLGSVAGNELSLASIGFFAGGNNTSLGIRAYRNSAGSGWSNTALLLGYDVDNTVRASSGFLALNSNGNIGIGITNPQYPLDINGRMRLNGTNPNDPGVWLNDAGVDRGFVGLQNNNHIGFYGTAGIGWGFTMNTGTGALALNGSEGQAGQVITAVGVGQPASWINPLNQLYNNMTEYAQIGTTTLGPLTNTNMAGMSGIVLNIGTRSKVIFSSSVSVTSNYCFGCGGSHSRLIIQVNFPGGQAQDGGTTESDLGSGEIHVFVTGDKIWTLNPGSYTINTILTNENLSGPSVTGSYGRLNIIIIPE